MNKILLNNHSQLINLLNFDRNQMRTFLVSIEEKSFRADQIMIWIYHNFCSDFDKMTNITSSLKNKLKKMSIISSPIIITENIAQDYTIKWLMKVQKGMVETVFIPEKNRGTLCISSQVGCNLGCKFCATGMQGFNGNLSVSEIVGQIWIAYKRILAYNQSFRFPITNIVMMGMGEPLLNLRNVITALNIIFDKHGFKFSKRKVILSTSGVVPALNKLLQIIDVKLAISLHASNDIIRDQIMPINKKYNISMLLQSLSNILKISKLNKDGIIIEYVMLHNINDRLSHAQELLNILKNIPSKINLIPWNSIPGIKFQTSMYCQIKKFACFLNKQGLTTTIRKSRGKDIQAACGQLQSNI